MIANKRRFGGRSMFRKVLVLALVLGLFTFNGCLTKPISYVAAVATEAVHPDGPLSSFIGYGPWSSEFADSIDHFETHRRSYLKDMESLVSDWDRHFLNYDTENPFSE
jgi:hypothetical protein